MPTDEWPTMPHFRPYSDYVFTRNAHKSHENVQQKNDPHSQNSLDVTARTNWRNQYIRLRKTLGAVVALNARTRRLFIATNNKTEPFFDTPEADHKNMCRTPPAPATGAAHLSSPNAAKEEAVGGSDAATTVSPSSLSNARYFGIGYWLSGIAHCWRVTAEYYRAGQFSWPLISYMIFVHAVAIRGVMAIPHCMPQTALFAFFLVPIRYASRRFCCCS